MSADTPSPYVAYCFESIGGPVSGSGSGLPVAEMRKDAPACPIGKQL
jgi:hypothetical protein